MPFELPRDRMLTCMLASSDVTTMLSRVWESAKLLIQSFSFFGFQREESVFFRRGLELIGIGVKQLGSEHN